MQLQGIPSTPNPAMQNPLGGGGGSGSGSTTVTPPASPLNSKLESGSIK
ncbi:MAG TPA: hypothetical protein VIF60_08605 [Burkholderiaceae bacterium]